MANYVNELFDKYISDKEVKEAVLLKNPCPENVNPVRRIDDFWDDLMKETKRTF